MDDVGRHALRDGRSATIRRSACPLPPAEGGRLGWLLEGAFGADETPDLFVTVAARGLLEEVARNRFAWAEVDGSPVSAAWTMTPADDPRIGSLGEVFTDPPFRGEGLAPAVCRSLLDAFDADGGRRMYLATGNPSAARIYRGLGFEPAPEGLMVRDRPSGSAFESDWFATSEVAIRDVHWGDVPRIVALYQAPSPFVSMCWMQGFFSAAHVTHNRCNSLVRGTWQATRAGAWLAMTNASGAVVGLAALQPVGNEKAPVDANVDLFVHEAFLPHAGALLGEACATAARRGWRRLTAEVTDTDPAKHTLLRHAGFGEVAVLRARQSLGGRLHSVHLMRAEVG